MGTDIHGIFQRHDAMTQTWEDVPSAYEFNRHYQLFAVLAGVRNGIGFAGVPTGEPVKPIAEPRGLPEDFLIGDGVTHPIASVGLMPEWRRKYHTESDALEVWLGDHSFSWLDADEICAYRDKAPTVVKVGIVDRAEYSEWDKKSTPRSYCGGVGGPGVVIVNDNALEMKEKPNWSHVRVTWESSLKSELAYFFNEVDRLRRLHGKVRFVFGFDS